MRRTLQRRCFREGDIPFQLPQPPTAGGVPFFGNPYSGKVNDDALRPPTANKIKPGPNSVFSSRKNPWSDPEIRPKIDRCPYFALVDQVIFHNMDPTYLDPGLITDEEHHLLLLFSRAYFEKWRPIHERPATISPRLRLVYGRSTLTEEMFDILSVSRVVGFSLLKEFMLDDAYLIAMNPRCWSTAHLDPANMDHFSGRVLEFAGMDKSARDNFFLLLDQMRRLPVNRRIDGEWEKLVIPFEQCTSLEHLYQTLNADPSAVQLKSYDYVNSRGVSTVVTFRTEDDFFDFKVDCFLKANLRLGTIGDVADTRDCCSRYSITVVEEASQTTRSGRWF
jgi:hypothetical protein